MPLNYAAFQKLISDQSGNARIEYVNSGLWTGLYVQYLR